MTLPKLRSAAEADAEQAIAALALAFATNPVTRAFYPDPFDHPTHFSEIMRINIAPAIARHAADDVDGFSAAALWIPPTSSDRDGEAQQERGRRVGALIEKTASTRPPVRNCEERRVGSGDRDIIVPNITRGNRS